MWSWIRNLALDSNCHAFMIFLIVAWVFAVLVLAPTLYAFIIGAPIFFSPKKAVVEALLFCEAGPGMKFYDLGMGTGRVMLAAAKASGVEVYGLELSPLLFVIARLNLFFHGVRRPVCLLKNFYRQDLSQADIVFCFLTPPAMRRLRPKFEKELKSGTSVISYAFRIDGWEPVKVIQNGCPGNTYIYRKN